MSLDTVPLAVVREPGFDCYGAKTSRRVYRRGETFAVVTLREFYSRRGAVDDYEFSTETFVDLSAALTAAGAPLHTLQVAA